MATATPAQVKAAAVRWLDAPHYTMVVRPFPKLAPGETTLDRKVVPPLGEAPAVGFPAVQRTTLKNGLSVVLLERHATPIVNVALAVDAGYAADEPGQGRPGRARAQPARRRHVDARRLPRGRRARRARRPHHDAQLARPVVRAAAGAAGQPRAVAAAHGRRRAEPGVPGGSGRAREAPADRADRPGEGRSADRGAAGRAAAALRHVARLRQPVHRDRRRIDGRVRSPATICCAGTGRGSRRTAAR